MAATDPRAELRARCAEPLQHPELPELHTAAGEVVAFALDEFARLPEKDAGPTATREAMERVLREPLPEHGSDLARVLAEFRAHIAPYNMRPHHPRFLAFVPAAPTFVAILGDWLCAATNAFAGVWKESAAAAEVELVVLDWFKQLMAYPSSAAGLLSSGGSEANLIALTVARDQRPYEVRSRLVLYASEQRHWSIDRAARVIGLRPDQLRLLPSGPDYRLDPATLAAAVERDAAAGQVPWLVVANAGATNTGAVDPLDTLARVGRERGLWLHADAAYGWPAVLTAEGRAELRGLEHADSVTLDPHKWLAQTYDVGCLLVRSGALLAQTFAGRPEYLQDVAPAPGEVNFADLGLALTRRFRALKLWLSLKVLGVAWFRRLVAHGCDLAAYAQALLEDADGFEVVSPRRLSTLCFRFVPPGAADEQQLHALNQALCEDVQRSGRAFLATTRLRGCTVLRLCFVNWRTTAADVEEVIGLVQALAHRREKGQQEPIAS